MAAARRHSQLRVKAVRPGCRLRLLLRSHGLQHLSLGLDLADEPGLVVHRRGTGTLTRSPGLLSFREHVIIDTGKTRSCSSGSTASDMYVCRAIG